MDANQALTILTDSVTQKQRVIDAENLAISVLNTTFQPQFKAREDALTLLNKEKIDHENDVNALSDTVAKLSDTIVSLQEQIAAEEVTISNLQDQITALTNPMRQTVPPADVPPSTPDVITP